MTNFTLIIPLYNEEANIQLLFNELLNVKVEDFATNIIFVNDGSTDKTLPILKKITQNYSKVIILNNTKNFGQSYSIYNAIKIAKTKYIITLDGDLQNDPNDILKLIEKFTVNVSLVAGIRKKRKDNFIKIFSSKIANIVRSFILQDGCIDTGCSLKIFDKEVFLSYKFFNGMHRFIPALFKAKNKNIIYIDVNHRHRLKGVSKYGTFDRLTAGIRDLIKVYLIIRKVKKFN